LLYEHLFDTLIGDRKAACLAYDMPSEPLRSEQVQQLTLWSSGWKRCRMCGETKLFAEFHRNRSKPDGLQDRCRPCNIALNKQWYRDHPEARPNRMDPYARRRIQQGQRKLLDYLRSHPCVDCGESDPVLLEFDHLRDKTANISAMVFGSRPWPIIEAEIEKCEVVCANCHRRRTARRASTFRFRHGDADPGT
jgi:hypothetical protein